MEEFKAQIIAIAGAALTAAITYVAAIVRNKIVNSREKVQRPMIEKLNEALNSEFLLPILRNVYQTYVKKQKNSSWTTEEQEEAIDKAYESLIALLPKYLLNIAKKLYPSYKVTLKEKIQNFYEANKNKINIDIVQNTKEIEE